MNKPNFPEFNSTSESMSQFMDRVSTFNTDGMRNKYSYILEFVNYLVPNNKKTYRSLTEFCNVSADDLLPNLKHNKRIMTKFTPILAKELGINILELKYLVTNENNELDPDIENIIVFLKKILNSIDYSLTSKIIDDRIFYSIKARPLQYANDLPNNNTRVLQYNITDQLARFVELQR